MIIKGLIIMSICRLVSFFVSIYVSLLLTRISWISWWSVSRKSVSMFDVWWTCIIKGMFRLRIGIIVLRFIVLN